MRVWSIMLETPVAALHRGWILFNNVLLLFTICSMYTFNILPNPPKFLSVRSLYWMQKVYFLAEFWKLVGTFSWEIHVVTMLRRQPQTSHLGNACLESSSVHSSVVFCAQLRSIALAILRCSLTSKRWIFLFNWGRKQSSADPEPQTTLLPCQCEILFKCAKIMRFFTIHAEILVPGATLVSCAEPFPGYLQKYSFLEDGLSEWIFTENYMLLLFLSIDGSVFSEELEPLVSLVCQTARWANFQTDI